MRGNVLDLAVGVIIGAAFQAIVTSLTSDIISPILGIFGGVNFDQFQVTINGATITDYDALMLKQVREWAGEGAGDEGNTSEDT